MAATHLFEDFGGLPKKTNETSNLGAEEVEDQKLQAFENGYQAGWDDAIKAQSETGKHVSAGLATSLQDASLEYEEMRKGLNAAVSEVMSGIVRTLLPTVARESLGTHICEQIKVMTQSKLERKIEVAVAPETEKVVRSMLDSETNVTCDITTDPLLAPTQAFLRLGPDECEINLDQMLNEIAQSVTNFFESQNAELTNG